MGDLFDDPGDLGFFWDEDEVPEQEEQYNPFYEPIPGEEYWED